MAKVTMKMIAERCGVSAAQVSACLSGNKKIGVSPVKAALIRKVVAEMNYEPNVIARSIRTRKVPIVGAFFGTTSGAWQLHQRYFQTHLMELAAELNKNELEVVFIPYSSEKDQLEHLKRAISRGIIGGIVSNIIPDSNTEFCTYLKDCGLPYMVMGKPAVSDVYSVSCDNSAIVSVFEDCYKKSGCKHCFRVWVNHGELYFYSGLTIDFSNPELRKFTLDDIRPIADDSYFIISGHELFSYMRHKGFMPPHILLCERTTAYWQPASEYDFISVEMNSSRTGYINTSLIRWMKSGIKPKTFSHTVSDHENIEVFLRKK